jgi:HSP20 family protein
MSKQPGSKTIRYGPYVYGFTMRTGPDGKPIIEEFGNVRPPSRELPSGEREPLVDVIEDEKQVTVIAELPGVEKEDIKVKASGKNLSIKVDTPERKYSKNIALPAEVKSESAKASYKNGVLEIRFEKKAPTKEAGTEIKVE